MKKNKIKSTWVYRFFNKVYMVYAGLFWIVSFLFLLPLFVLSDLFKLDKFGLWLNHYWASFFFPAIAVPVSVEYKRPLDKKSNYIFCANHFSYLDIALMPFMPVPIRFVGKLSISKVPFFGYMFKRFHITIDRSSIRERYATYKKAIDALKDGFSLGIFPEGGIKSKTIPTMAPFKDGPFRMAVETGVQIVPVTMADNWKMLPDSKKFKFNRLKCRMIVHEPVDPSQFTIDTLKEFQEKVYQIIQTDINRLNSINM